MEYRLPILLMVSTLLILGCGDQSMDANEPEEELPTDVSYSEEIQPIFSTSCSGAGCHIDRVVSGVELTTYDDVMNSVGDQYGKRIVDPGNPEGSPLVDKITPNPDEGDRMPPTGDYLSDEKIDLIRGWIAEGAKDN